MKTIDDALELRGRIFGAFELAELESDIERRDTLLTFAVVGAGPTGVELAGQIAELRSEGWRAPDASLGAGQPRPRLVLSRAPRRP
jgi:NADH dehydrogenase